MTTMPNEWICVKDQLPPVQKGFINLTNDVLVKFKDGNIKKGFYYYKSDRWHTGDGRSHSNSEITHWKEIIDNDR